MKPLILYYSYTGHTRQIAERIQKALGGERKEIQTETPYTGSYDAVVQQAQEEIRRGFQPAILPLNLNIDAYDTILLGSPVWWYTYAPAMSSALTQYSFAGKTVYPFATNAGWLGHTFSDVVKACPGAAVKRGLDIRFDEDRLITPKSEIEAWIQAIAAEARAKA